MCEVFRPFIRDKTPYGWVLVYMCPVKTENKKKNDKILNMTYYKFFYIRRWSFVTPFNLYSMCTQFYKLRLIT